MPIKTAMEHAKETARHFQMLSRLGRPQIMSLVKNTFDAWSDDNAPRLGAALAFYTALSLAPLIVVVLAVAGLAFGRQAVEGQLVSEIQNTVGQQGATVIQDVIKSAQHPASGIIATILGLITLFFGATSVVVELQDALNTIWRAKKPSTQTGLKSLLKMVKDRVESFAMVLGIGFLLLVSLVVSAGLSAVGHFFGNSLPMPEIAIHAIYLFISFVGVAFLFAVIYKVLPDVDLEWSDVAIGAAVTSILFSLGKLALGLYLGKSTVGSPYGAAGSFVVVLVWVYYSAQIFFLGAEFTRVYARQFGSHFRSSLTKGGERGRQDLVGAPSPAL